MSLVAVSQPETDENQPKTPWDLTADCTRFVIAWSERTHRVQVDTIFEVFRQELLRREGLRHYGVRPTTRSNSSLRLLRSSAHDDASVSGSVISADAAQGIAPYAPKLLSNKNAA